MDELTSDNTYKYTYNADGDLIQRINRTNSADAASYAYYAQNCLVQMDSPLGTGKLRPAAQPQQGVRP